VIPLTYHRPRDANTVQSEQNIDGIPNGIPRHSEKQKSLKHQGVNENIW
jgi:hypothetical protein